MLLAHACGLETRLGDDWHGNAGVRWAFNGAAMPRTTRTPPVLLNPTFFPDGHPWRVCVWFLQAAQGLVQDPAGLIGGRTGT